MLRKIDPIPELENLIAFGVKEARDDDLLTRFGQLRVQVNSGQATDPANWLGIYRNALKLADLIRPIRTKDEATKNLSFIERSNIQAELIDLCEESRNACTVWRARLNEESLFTELTKKMGRYVADLEFITKVSDDEQTLHLSETVQAKLTSRLSERAEAFANEYFEGLERHLAETYKAKLQSIRKRLGQVALRRPRILRGDRVRFRFGLVPKIKGAPRQLPVTLKQRLLERRQKRERSDELKSAYQHCLFEYIEGELERLKDVLTLNLKLFEDKLTEMLEQWLEAATVKLEQLTLTTVTARREHRPLTLGRRLEAEIIPALMKRIEHLEY